MPSGGNARNIASPLPIITTTFNSLVLMVSISLITCFRLLIKEIDTINTSEFKVVVMIGKGDAIFLALPPDGIQSRSKRLHALTRAPLVRQRGQHYNGAANIQAIANRRIQLRAL